MFPNYRTEIFIERYAVTTLANLCDGDARAALNALQMTVQSQSTTQTGSDIVACNKDSDRSSRDANSDDEPIRRQHVIKVCNIKEGLQRSHILYDRVGKNKVCVFMIK